MSIETDMMSLCKSLHKEVISTLRRKASHLEFIVNAVDDLDRSVKRLMELISMKEHLDEDEKKELRRIHRELVDFYKKIDKDQIDDKRFKELQEIYNEELKLEKEAISDVELNKKMEDQLGEVYDKLKLLFDEIERYKNEDMDDALFERAKHNLFEEEIKFMNADTLLEYVMELKDRYEKERGLMEKVEDIEQKIRKGEMTVQQLLEQYGLHLQKELLEAHKINSAVTHEDDNFKLMLTKIIKLIEILEKEKAEEI